MSQAQKSPAQHVLKRLRESALALTTRLQFSDRLQVAIGLRELASGIEAVAQSRIANRAEIERVHLENLLLCQDYLAARGVVGTITRAHGEVPVLVAGELQIAYDDVRGKFHSQIGAFQDSAFSHIALCLTAIEKLRTGK